MRNLKPTKTLLVLALSAVFMLYLTACNENSVEENQTDDQYISEIITNGYSNPNAEDDDLLKAEVTDFDDGGAVPDFDNGGDTPIDSLMRWGRIVTGNSVNVNITNEGDSIKNVNITRTITGNYVIVGVVNGVVDTIFKPYTQEFRRKAVFKRIGYNPRPRQNWRLYKVSMVDGRTTSPQNSDDYVQMQQIEVYVNGTLRYTFAGPDFTQNIFTTRRFDGSGIPEVNAGDQVRFIVTTSSAQSEQDIVAWHWGKRNFGFHREPFVMTSETPGGLGWVRTYEKTFTIHMGHHRGRFNGFISSSTRKSLYDDSPVEFASDAVGTPYRVLP
ncbi:MAG: hypothetical protein UZ05_CHB002002447 [Chlorobi bacterium OLB5]|nr:MAG: hypothetical protein UZ05_CHB002002447 [Chlorobi bacterium OLB5]